MKPKQPDTFPRGNDITGGHPPAAAYFSGEALRRAGDLPGALLSRRKQYDHQLLEINIHYEHAEAIVREIGVTILNKGKEEAIRLAFTKSVCNDFVFFL